jgi:hypothetical protein
MRRLIVLPFMVAPLVAGCGLGSKADTEAAKEFVHKFYSNPHIKFEVTRVEPPEYATVPKIPRDHIAPGYPDRSAASCVRVWFTWRDGNSTTRDDWLVWVGSDHKAVGWSTNPDGDNWRHYVRSLANK